MNCCDDYGNCTNGKDCAIRTEKTKEPQERDIHPAWLIAAFLGLIVVGATYDSLMWLFMPVLFPFAGFVWMTWRNK